MPETIKKETLAQVFSSEFCEISKNTFFNRTPPMAASGYATDITIFFNIQLSLAHVYLFDLITIIISYHIIRNIIGIIYSAKKIKNQMALREIFLNEPLTTNLTFTNA